MVRPGNSAVRVGLLIGYLTVSARSAVLLVMRRFEYKFTDMKKELNETLNSAEANSCSEHVQTQFHSASLRGDWAKDNPIRQPETSFTNSLDQITLPH